MISENTVHPIWRPIIQVANQRGHSLASLGPAIGKSKSWAKMASRSGALQISEALKLSEFLDHNFLDDFATLAQNQIELVEGIQESIGDIQNSIQMIKAQDSETIRKRLPKMLQDLKSQIELLENLTL